MSLARFNWTARAHPVVEIGIGDKRFTTTEGIWDISRWDTGATWAAGNEPQWLDVTCYCQQLIVRLERQANADRFVAGRCEIVATNEDGWADMTITLPSPPDAPGVLYLRPGRQIRVGVDHSGFGMCWLFRGWIDEIGPSYDAVEEDTVMLRCIDALGELGRIKLPDRGALNDAPDGETVIARINRILSLAAWPRSRRQILFNDDTPLIADRLVGQVADLLGRTADSAGGSIYGDTAGRIVYRPRRWQAFDAAEAPDAILGNADDLVLVDDAVLTDDDGTVLTDEDGTVLLGGVAATTARTICPSKWVRPFARADITTRVILANRADPPLTYTRDNPAAVTEYNVEPFERLDLLTRRLDDMGKLANTWLQTRNPETQPRIQAVTVDAAAAGDSGLDLLSTVDIYEPSRYRCLLDLDRGVVFDRDYLATGVRHDITPESWVTDISLDDANVYALAADAALWAPAPMLEGRWDTSTWQESA